MSSSYEVLHIVESIKPHLARRDPELQGAVLAELLSLWLAGHPPDLREPLLASHLEAVHALTQVNAKLLRGENA